MGLFKKKEASSEFKEYMEKYLREECEGEPFELIGLLGYNLAGAGKSRGSEFYSQYFNCVATIENNHVTANEIKLVKFLDNTSPLEFLQVNDLTPYNFVVKKVKNKNLYCIIELIGKNNTNLFDSIIEELSKTILIKEDNDVFEYNRRYNEYEGEVVINDKKIKISLRVERNSIDATESLATFKKIKSDFNNFYKTVLLRCSEKMTRLANDWREDGDTHEITTEEFQRRIDSDTLIIDIFKEDYTIYFEDDDMFWGHTIQYDGNINTNEFDATIAG